MGSRRSRAPAAFHGFVFVDKPAGWTSHDVVQKLRRVYGQREVGHTGTLDPMATGLLIVALGRATRLARFVEARDKTYDGVVRLGVGTDTYDAEGEVVAEGAVATDVASVDRALRDLCGTIDQAVPPHSAVKVGGQRLYARARRGERVETPVRTVTIHELQRLGLDGPNLRVRARVSKGTYIRSLAVQIGERLGGPAHLTALRRTAVGTSGVEDARAPEALSGTPEEVVPAARALAGLPTVALSPDAVREVGFGRPLGFTPLAAGWQGPTPPGWAPGDLIVLCDQDRDVIAVAEARASAPLSQSKPEEPAVRYLCVLRPASS